MPKVLLNLLGGSPNKPSGVAIYALRTFEALLRRGRFDYAILTAWDREALAAHLPLDGVEVIPGYAHRSEKLQYWVENWQVAQAARQIGADVVFTPWPFAPLIGGKKRILVLHDLYRQTHPGLYPWHYRLAWKVYFSLSVAHSQHVVTVSETTRRAFVELFPGAADKATTVLEASTIEAQPRPTPLRAGRYGLTVSTTAPTKNLPRLIEALDILRRRGAPQTPVVWVGEDHGGVVKACLERFPQLQTFIPVGRVDEETLATWYAHADFYLAASLTEGFCLPIVEAQKFGVPTVCSDVPIFREVAGDGGLFFDPLSPEAIADGVAAIAAPATRARLSAAATANASRFSWDKAAAQLEQLIAS